MLAAYLFCLVAGGILVGISAAFGGKDADFGGKEIDLAHAAHAPGDADVAHAPGWLPFLSFQFWTFALTFFGLTGAVLTGLGLAGTWATLAAALGLGLGSGTAVSWVLRKLRTQVVSSSVGSRDFVGRSAAVKVPLRAGSPGKIRISIKGSVVDLLAVTDEREELAAGEEVLIVGLEDGRAQVVRAVRVEAPDEAAAAESVPSSAPPTPRKHGDS